MRNAWRFLSTSDPSLGKGRREEGIVTVKRVPHAIPMVHTSLLLVGGRPVRGAAPRTGWLRSGDGLSSCLAILDVLRLSDSSRDRTSRAALRHPPACRPGRGESAPLAGLPDVDSGLVLEPSAQEILGFLDHSPTHFSKFLVTHGCSPCLCPFRGRFHRFVHYRVRRKRGPGGCAENSFRPSHRLVRSAVLGSDTSRATASGAGSVSLAERPTRPWEKRERP